jgi:hypothetical protein
MEVKFENGAYFLSESEFDYKLYDQYFEEPLL